jgi:hypothetical protein
LAISVAAGSFARRRSTLPKFENDSIATRGSTPSALAQPAVSSAISASSSALGSMLTAQSARKYTSLGSSTM